MHKENIIVVVVVVTFLLAFLLFGFIASILVLYQKKEVAFERRLEDVKNKFRQELLQSQLDIQEQTLMNISRDIHDNIGQYISSAKHCLNTMQLHGEAEEKRLLAVDCLTKGLDDMRDLSRSLSLELIRSYGLPYAIENLVDQLKKSSTFTIIFRTAGNYGCMDEQREIFLFRILQECFSNIMRHAFASEINVLLDCSAIECVKLLVQDNGRGFSSDTAITSETGYGSGGISHMLNRSKLIDGKISIESYPGKGTRVNITIPYHAYATDENLYRVGRRPRVDYPEPGDNHQ